MSASAANVWFWRQMATWSTLLKRDAMALEYRPLYAVSGDFYDLYTPSKTSVAYLVCDASGHGVPAALLTMMAKSQ